jgi:hypothetical protein
MKLRPCNLKSNSGFLGKQSAGQKDDAEQDVKTVVHLAQLQPPPAAALIITG